MRGFVSRRSMWLIAVCMGIVTTMALAQEEAPYRVLSRAKTSELQLELQAASDQGYRLAPNQGPWLMTVVVEKVSDAERVDYLLLATSKTSTMQKEMNDAAGMGYRFATTINDNRGRGTGGEVVLVMQRPKGASARTHEQLLLATLKITTMEKELLEQVAKGFRYAGQAVFTGGWGGAEWVAILERPVN